MPLDLGLVDIEYCFVTGAPRTRFPWIEAGSPLPGEPAAALPNPSLPLDSSETSPLTRELQVQNRTRLLENRDHRIQTRMMVFIHKE